MLLLGYALADAAERLWFNAQETSYHVLRNAVEQVGSRLLELYVSLFGGEVEVVVGNHLFFGETLGVDKVAHRLEFGDFLQKRFAAFGIANGDNAVLQTRDTILRGLRSDITDGRDGLVLGEEISCALFAIDDVVAAHTAAEH